MASSSKDILKLLGRLVLGGLFLVAGLAKLSSPLDFAKSISNYQLLPDNLTFLAGLWLPWLEVLVGACLLLGLFTGAAGLLAGILSGMFAYAIGNAVGRGLTVDCGCFAGDTTATWGHAGLNLVMLLVAGGLVHGGAGRWALDSRLGLGDSQSPPPRKQRLVALGACLLFIFNAGYIAADARKGGGAAKRASSSRCPIVFSQISVDFGKVTQGQRQSQEVRFTNISKNRVHIEEIDSSCGCTTTQPSKRILAPGEMATLVVSFDPGAKRGPTETAVVMHIKDATEPAILKVGADVQPVLEFVPGLLELKPGESAKVRLERRQPEVTFEVNRIVCPNEALQAKVVKSSADVVEIEVKAISKLPAPESPQTAWRIHVFTTIPNLPPFSLYVKGEL